MRSYKKLLLHADISDSSGNCRVLDTTSILTVSSGGASKKDSILQQVDLYDVRKHNIHYHQYIESMQDHNYDVLSKEISLTDYSENVVSYIAGYVIRMMKKTVHCEECLSLLIEENPNQPNYYLIKRRNLGNSFFF